MRIKFNIEETIQSECELDLADSERVIRRAEEMKQGFNRPYYPDEFWITAAVQELLDKGEIYAKLIDKEHEENVTSAWKHEEDS